MPRSSSSSSSNKAVVVTTEEIEHLLSHILETIIVYEYPTPSIFSALTRLGIVGYLRGKGITENIELFAVDIFRQLSEYALQNPDYSWFTEWSKKLVGAVKGRKVAE